ncbi:ARF GAP with effector function(s), partial [Elasticomyces elasticus]
SPPPSKPAEKPSPFANLTNFASAKSHPAAPKVSSPTASAGGNASLFDSLTSPTGTSSKPQSRNDSFSLGQDLGFTDFASPPPQQQPSKPSKPPQLSQPLPPGPSASDDLFGLSSPPPTTTAAPPPVRSPQQEMKSAFNLNPSPPPPPKPQPETATVSTPAVNASMLSSSIDPWGGGNNAWGAPDPEPVPAEKATASMMKVPEKLTAND